MRALFRYADAEHARHYTKLHQKLCVVARGGYGRAELNPYSDIDLLFIHDYKRGPYAEIVTEIMLHALWDAGLIVGHGIRNARECVRMAGADLKEKTAILDARFLAGDDAIWAELQGAAGRGGPQSQSAQVFPDQARGNSRASRQVWRFDLPAGAANEGRRRRTARSAHRSVAGKGKIQNPFGRGTGSARDHHRARAGRGAGGARFSFPRAQLAAFSSASGISISSPSNTRNASRR